MKPWMIIIGILIIITLVIIGRVIFELHSPVTVYYKLESAKISGSMRKRIIFISDLHSRKYGKNNEKLIALIKMQYPDYIFVGGDMIIASKGKNDDSTKKLLAKLSEISAVYYAPGNHEKELQNEKFKERFSSLLDCMKENEIKYLDNKVIQIADNVKVYGLDIDMKYYKKFKPAVFSFDDLKNNLGFLDKNCYNILLAHTPKYFDVYEQAGFDLILSGHYHGGAVCLAKSRGIISPQLVLFPEYCKGKFTKNNSDLIVTSGCGSHKVNLRLNNKPEVMVIDIYGNLI